MVSRVQDDNAPIYRARNFQDLSAFCSAIVHSAIFPARIKAEKSYEEREGMKLNCVGTELQMAPLSPNMHA